MVTQSRIYFSFFLISLYCLVEENFPRKMQLFGLINQSYNFIMQGI